jgi:hypothetical protein
MGFVYLVALMLSCIAFIMFMVYNELSRSAVCQFYGYEFEMNMILLASVSRRCSALIESQPECCDVDKFYEDEFEAKVADYHINYISLMFNSLTQFKTPEQYLRNHPQYKHVYELVDAQK